MSVPSSVVEIAPVVKTVTLRRAAADAFRAFVHETDKWWPLATHALSPENNTKAIALVVEPRVGGRMYERTEDGREFDWGEVLAYEAGVRFAITWQLGRPRSVSGEIDVRFEALSESTCRVTLTHSGWERVENGEQVREGYNVGWSEIIERRFADFAG